MSWRFFALLLVFTSVPGMAKKKPLAAPVDTQIVEESTDSVDDIPELNIGTSESVRLSLQDSVGMAIQAATSVLKAKNNLDVTGAALLQSYGQFLPNLVASANNTWNQGNIYYAQSVPTLVNTVNAGAGYSLNADLNLFNGLSDYAHLRASILRKDASDLTLYRAKQAIALDVTQSFLTVILDERLLEFARKNLQQSVAREKLLLEQTRVGAKSLADLFRQQAQKSADQSLLLNAENRKRSDQILLLQKLRADVARNYQFVDDNLIASGPDSRFDDEQSLLHLGLNNRADLKATNKTSDAFHYDVDSQWGNYLPKLDLQGGVLSSGSYLYQQSTSAGNLVPPNQNPLYNQLANQVDYTVGIVLSWTIFDRFLTRQQVAQARADARNAEIDAQDLHNQVQADVRLAFSSYKTAIQQLKASKKGLESAQKAYEVIEGRYEVGSANFIDLVTAQSALLQAESARAQALIDFVLQGKTVEFSTGETKVD